MYFRATYGVKRENREEHWLYSYGTCTWAFSDQRSKTFSKKKVA